MAGTTSTPIFVNEAMYLSMVADNAITLGNCVKFTTTGTDTCDVGSANTTFAGVAVSGDRFSRTATDNTIAAGNKVTVATRGVVRVYTGTSAIVRGSLLEMGASGIVELNTTAGTLVPGDVIGIALDANGSAATTIRMLIRSG
jgi:hypothetical protein